MKKYLFIAAHGGPTWGGSEPLWASAAEHLVRQGNEVVASIKDRGRPIPQVDHLRSAGCQIFLRDDRIPPFFLRQVHKIFPPTPYPEAHVRSLAKGADLIIISQGDNCDGLEWIEAARATGLPYAIIAQGACEQWWPLDDAAERLAACYENARAAYFVSEANLSLSRRQFVSPLTRARVIRNPFNVRYDARPPWPGGVANALLLACVGRLETYQKGQDILFQVLDRPVWRDRNVSVTLFGKGRTERGLRRWAEAAHLSSVTFGGFSEDIEQIWSRHHALVLPSRYEGMPLVLVEAMLCGRPAIITDVAGARELVRDNVNGFLAKAPTVELFDEAMNRAWENRHRLKEMGEQAARDVRQWVSPDPGADLARELLSLIESPVPVAVPSPQKTLEARA